MYTYNYQKSFKKERTLWEEIVAYFHKIPFLGNINFTKEAQLISLFSLLFLIIIIKLFSLQIIQHDDYSAELMKQSTSLASVNANRWDIYALDKTWQPVKLTENINLYDVAVDPREIGYKWWVRQKERFIELITPVVYKHLCEIHWMDNIDTTTEEGKKQCMSNIESFANIELLPKLPEFFYYWKSFDAEWNEVQIFSPEYATFDFENYNQKMQKAINDFTKENAIQIIKTRLNDKIKIWIKEKNYVWYFTNEDFLKALDEQHFNFISIESDYYVYVVPSKSNTSRDKLLFQTFMAKRWEKISSATLDSLFKEQEYKYIKLFSSANPQIAQSIKNLKTEYASEKYSLDGSPYNKYSILHWIVLESYMTRYYPYWNFMSNILWYVDKNWEAFYGIEKYFNEILKWIDWEITWRSSWNMWGGDFEVINTKDGDDVVLTVDIGIQKEAEAVANKYLNSLKADSIAIMVYDPQAWEIKASASLPTYNPNNYDDAYTIIPLSPEYAYIIDDDTYNEVPVYIYSGWKYTKATSEERKDTSLKKFIAKNIYWAQVFIDKNIATTFEPWSIFKSFTVAIGLDSDEVRLDDYYDDEWSITIDQFTIPDADKTMCMWHHSFQDALINSCNVWMIRIVLSIWKEVFYNYLTKLWFWEATWIELAEEKNWYLPNPTNVGMATFFNNSFGQSVTVTQIQLAAAYSTLINWGKYKKPSIVSLIREKSANSDTFVSKTPTAKAYKQIFRHEVSEEMRTALFSVVETNKDYKYAKVVWYRLWAKSWTSQIAYKWKYQKWEWWTQATFAWVISIDNPQYIVLIWVSRPRTNQWWVATAWKIFNEIATFLIWYSMIE